MEVMIAVGIMGICLLGSLSMLNAEWNLIRKTKERLYVNRILESRLEEIRDLTFDELEALEEEIDFAILPATTVFGKTINPYVIDTGYQMDLQESSGTVYVDTVEAGLKKVTVEVSWRSGARNQLSLKTATFITRNGVSRQ